MIPSLPINEHCHTYSCGLAARRTQARIHPLNSPTTALAITPHNLQCAHLHQPAHHPDSAKISLHPSPPHLIRTADVPKSP
jgi:hypothetical protein